MRALSVIRRRGTAAVLAVLATVAIGATVAPPAAQAQDNYRITLAMSECGIMAVGVKGTCIRSLQTWLNIVMNSGLVVDGYFGPETRKAVVAFQRRFGLAPDGRFGNNSRNALKGWYYDLTQNSVPTPRPAPKIKVADRQGSAQQGLNSGTAYTVVTAVACGGVGVVVGALATPPVGFGAGLFCDILLDD